MNRIVCILFCLMLAAPFCAKASGIRYYEDPVYVKLNADDEHPMQDLVMLAQRGDARAQFILADLYAKGKGGLAKSLVKGRFWFESSARHGVSAAFIRLAALSRRAGDEVSAFKWYTLSVDLAGGKEAKWSRDARARLVRDAHMTPADINSGKDAARIWKAQQGEALRALQKKEQIARETQPEPDLDDKPKDKTPAKGKTARQEPPQRQQEYRYNE